MGNQVAVVTGATRGIGRAIALELAGRGYDLVVNYRTQEKEALELCRAIEEKGVRALPVYADIGRLEDIGRMFEQIDAVFPQIHLLVNNAGISDEVYFLDATPEQFERMTCVDWRGLYFCSQYAAKRMDGIQPVRRAGGAAFAHAEVKQHDQSPQSRFCALA